MLLKLSLSINYIFMLNIFSIAILTSTCQSVSHFSRSGLPVHHQLPEFTQTHVHLVSDAIQPSHPFIWVNASTFLVKLKTCPWFSDPLCETHKMNFSGCSYDREISVLLWESYSWHSMDHTVRSLSFWVSSPCCLFCYGFQETWR